MTNETDKLLQERSESGNDALDRCRELMNRIEQRLTFDNPRLIQRYIEAKLLLRVRFLISGSDIEFEAFFQRIPTTGGSNVDLHGFEGRYSCGGENTTPATNPKLSEIYTCGLGTDSQQQAVLFNVVQSVENPEQVIPSFVWFESVNRVESLLSRSLHFSVFSGFVFRASLCNGEINPAGIRRVVPSITTHDLVGEIVKRTPEILNSVSSNQGNKFRDGINAQHVINQLACLRISLGPDFIRVGIEEGSQIFIKITDVLFGPFDF